MRRNTEYVRTLSQIEEAERMFIDEARFIGMMATMGSKMHNKIIEYFYYNFVLKNYCGEMAGMKFVTMMSGYDAHKKTSGRIQEWTKREEQRSTSQ